MDVKYSMWNHGKAIKILQIYGNVLQKGRILRQFAFDCYSRYADRLLEVAHFVV